MAMGTKSSQGGDCRRRHLSQARGRVSGLGAVRLLLFPLTYPFMGEFYRAACGQGRR